MKLTLIIPAYKRPDSLKRVIAAIEKQIRKPDQFIVVVRESDLTNHEVLNSYPWIQKVIVQKPRLTPALNAGLREATSEIVAFTDDDTEPFPDWLQKIEQYYLNNTAIGGVGGRDIIAGTTPKPGMVGQLDYWGRLRGQNHLGMGTPQNVQTFKGANMSYRRDLIALGFLEELRGDQSFNETFVGAQVLRQGFKMLYDPEIKVLHHAELRAEDFRGNREVLPNSAFNMAYTYAHIRSPIFSARFFIFSIIVGFSSVPGILKTLQILLRKKNPIILIDMLRGWLALFSGFIQGTLHAKTSAQ